MPILVTFSLCDGGSHLLSGGDLGSFTYYRLTFPNTCLAVDSKCDLIQKSHLCAGEMAQWVEHLPYKCKVIRARV